MKDIFTRKLYSQTLAPLGIVSGVLGFVFDVLAPLGDFAPWVAALSALAFMGALAIYLGMTKRKGIEPGESLMPGVLVVTAGSTVIFTFWSVLISTGPEEGRLASTFDSIAELQDRLLGIEEGITDIQETTAQTSEKIDQLAEAQQLGFEQMQLAFASLRSSQALVENPTTPQEWYSNARFYQLKGMTPEALKAYEAYFGFGLKYVDPYYEYVDLMKGTEGITRTRQSLQKQLNNRPDSFTLDLMVSRLLDSTAERKSRFELLAKRAPQYAPVFYELNQAYVDELKDAFTQNIREKQQETYQTLTTLEEQQLFSRQFIDKALAQSFLEKAKESGSFFAAYDNLKVELIPVFTPEGVQFSVVIPEQNIQDIRYNLNDPTPTFSTGTFRHGNMEMPNPSFGPLPYEKGDHTVYMQYTDSKGAKSKVYTYEYTVKDIINYYQMPVNFSTKTYPVMFQCSILGGGASDIYTYRYSVDSEDLDQSVTGVGMAGAIQVTAAKPGKYTLYVQGIPQGAGRKTEVIAFPYEVK